MAAEPNGRSQRTSTSRGRTETPGERRGYAPLIPTEDPITPAASKEIVVARMRLGVIHEKAFARSHTRMPVAPARALTAPMEH